MRVHELLEAQFRQPHVMFHGTSTVFLRTILSQGIVPNPKQRRWDTDHHNNVSTFSRISLPGSYWTSNLLTATGAAHNTKTKFGGEELLVIAQIAEQSAYADEDSIGSPIQWAVGDTMRKFCPGIVTDALHFLASLLLAPRDPAQADQIRAYFAEKLHEHLEGSEQQPINRAVTDELLETLVLRHLAYMAKSGERMRYILGDAAESIDIPSVDEMEHRLLDLRERLTRSYRRTAKHEHGSFSHTLRLNLPVSYRGANRILAVLELPPYRYVDGKSEVDPLILHYGQLPLPAPFLEQYRNRKGDFPGLVSPAGDVLMPSERTPR